MEILKELIELLLNDEHKEVKWGEEIPRIEEIKKVIDWMAPNSKRDGYLTITFKEQILREDLEKILKETEKIIDGEKGILTKEGYTALIYYIDSNGTIMTVKGKDAIIPIYYEGFKNYINMRAVDILEDYIKKRYGG